MSNIHIYGDHIDTDVIIPARYLNVSNELELAKHCMEDIDENFVEKVQPGDIVVAGINFGCGSSREHAPIALKASGVQCIIGKSFARIFFRNAFNIGLPVIESEVIVNDCDEGDQITIDFKMGKVKNITKDKMYSIPKLPPFMQGIIEAGGLVNYTRKDVDHV